MAKIAEPVSEAGLQRVQLGPPLRQIADGVIEAATPAPYLLQWFPVLQQFLQPPAGGMQSAAALAVRSSPQPGLGFLLLGPQLFQPAVVLLQPDLGIPGVLATGVQLTPRLLHLLMSGHGSVNSVKVRFVPALIQSANVGGQGFFHPKQLLLPLGQVADGAIEAAPVAADGFDFAGVFKQVLAGNDNGGRFSR